MATMDRRAFLTRSAAAALAVSGAQTCAPPTTLPNGHGLSYLGGTIRW
jgi:hypothetical protein